MLWSLQETLDDDQEMLDMYLGRRAKQEQAAAVRRASLEARQSRPGANSSAAPQPPRQPQQPQQAHGDGATQHSDDTVGIQQDGRSQQAAEPGAQHSQEVFGETRRQQPGDSPFEAAAAGRDGDRLPHSSSAATAQPQGQPQQQPAAKADWQRDADDLRSSNVRCAVEILSFECACVSCCAPLVPTELRPLMQGLQCSVSVPSNTDCGAVACRPSASQ